MTTGSGAGQANDADVEAVEGPTAEELAAWAEAKAVRDRDFAADEVERMKRKVEKAQADLTAAQQALADAEAAAANKEN